MRYSTEEQKYSFESNSESGKDFSVGSEDEYVLPQKLSSSSPSPSPPPKVRKNKSLRGINAHRAAVLARNSEWNVQPLTTDAPNVLISDRGRSRGRVRGRARGRLRSRKGRRESRAEMLAKDRQLVENLREEEIARESQQTSSPSPVPKLPPLNDGNLN